ncbi:MAG: YCF48-related protein [bacterium]
MKKLIYFLIIFWINSTLIDNLSFAQLNGGWIAQSPAFEYNLNDVKFTNENTGITIGANGVILRTVNGGDNWLPINSGTTKTLNSISLISNIAFIVGDSGIILKSTDLGISWLALNSGVIDNLNSTAFISADTGFVAGKKGKILKTLNSGLNWISSYSDTSVQFYSISFLNKNFIWIIGQKSHSTPIMINSNDLGSNWINHNINYFYNGSSIFFVDSLNGYAFSCTTVLNFGILKTSNGGMSWSCESGTFFQPKSVFFVNSLTGFAVGSGSGEYSVYKSSDGGIFWDYSRISFIYLDLKSSYFVNSTTGWIVGNMIYKTTNGGGSPLTGIQNNERVVTKYSLSQNYPNPFNPTTIINFDIPASGSVQLSIYNSEGKKIETLYGGELNSGSYSINFDGTKYSSGIYFYRLETNEMIFSKKMLLLK